MNNMRNKILSLLVLLLTAATGAQAGIKVGDVFMIGSYVDFGSSGVRLKQYISDQGQLVTFSFSGKLPMTYASYYEANKVHVFKFQNSNEFTFIYIESDNPAKPLGIKVSGGTGTDTDPFTFTTVYDWPDGHTADIIIDYDDTSSFAMPPCNATATYAIARELSKQTKVNVIIGSGDAATTVTADTRLRITNNNGVYAPVSALSCSFTDELENVSIDKDGLETAKLTPQFYLQGDNNTWTLVTDINATTHLPNGLQPGQVYCLTLKAADGSYYDGETEKSYAITLFEGYEVPVPSKEYVTYRSETEKLAIDTESGAKMYTVRGASSSAVTVSEETSVDAGLGILLYNPNDNDVTALLIPTETAMANAPQSDGTWSTVIGSVTASDDWDNYICNGYQFVITRGSGTLPANRWALALKKNQQQNARALTIAFDDATGISTTNFTNYTNEAWYDLNGRKLNGKPNRKGVYIMNGKKVLK